MAEAGLPGCALQSWYGVWAPEGTPAGIQQRITAPMNETRRDPEIAGRLKARLLEPVTESIDDAKRFIASEILRARALLNLVHFEPQ